MVSKPALSSAKARIEVDENLCSWILLRLRSAQGYDFIPSVLRKQNVSRGTTNGAKKYMKFFKNFLLKILFVNILFCKIVNANSWVYASLVASGSLISGLIIKRSGDCLTHVQQSSDALSGFALSPMTNSPVNPYSGLFKTNNDCSSLNFFGYLSLVIPATTLIALATKIYINRRRSRNRNNQIARRVNLPPQQPRYYQPSNHIILPDGTSVIIHEADLPSGIV